MYLADYHTHTQFSPDAHDPMTVIAQAALDAGMDEICFTDHVEPLTWGSNELRPPYDWSALTEDFANVQAALGDRIHLRLGMEMGDAQKAPAHMKKLLEDAPQFDFIIGSVHLLSERFGSEDLYLYTPKDQAEAQTALGDYLEEVLALAKLGSEKVGIFYILYVFLNPFDPVSVLNPAVRLWRSGYSSAYRSLSVFLSYKADPFRNPP